MGDYPEHEKLKALGGANQTIGGFLEWLEEEGIWLAKRHEHSGGCLCDNDEYHDGPRPRDPFAYCKRCGGGHKEGRRPICNRRDDELYAVHQPIEELIARHFEIDRGKLEAEKRAMLARLREVG